MRVSRFAGKHFLPVSIHHNIAPISRDPKEVKAPLYLDELVDLFRYCRWKEGETDYTTKFIWCHAGISRRVTVADLPYWIEEVLKESRDQVYIDLSWVVLENYIHKDLDRWVELIKKYPTQFMIGSDAIGQASKIKQELSRYDRLLSRLPRKARIRVAHNNFADLMQEMAEKRAEADLGEGGLILDFDYEFPEYAHTGRLEDSVSFTRSRHPTGK